MLLVSQKWGCVRFLTFLVNFELRGFGTYLKMIYFRRFYRSLNLDHLDFHVSPPDLYVSPRISTEYPCISMDLYGFPRISTGARLISTSSPRISTEYPCISIDLYGFPRISTGSLRISTYLHRISMYLHGSPRISTYLHRISMCLYRSKIMGG